MTHDGDLSHAVLMGQVAELDADDARCRFHAEDVRGAEAKAEDVIAVGREPVLENGHALAWHREAVDEEDRARCFLKVDEPFKAIAPGEDLEEAQGILGPLPDGLVWRDLPLIHDDRYGKRITV